MDPIEAEKNETWLPLSGHILFASIRWKQIDEVELQKNIHKLGGKLETFFSNEITCVLTDEMTVPVRRDNKTLKRNQNGKLLSQFPKHNNIVDKAKTLGIEVMRIETFLSWLKPHLNVRLKTQEVKKLSNLNKSTKLNGCFMKIESTSQTYSPVYKVYPDPPDVEFEKLYYKPVEDTVTNFSSNSSKSKSTFSVNIKLPDFLKVEENQLDKPDEKALFSFSSSEPVKKNSVKAKRHYCECCKMYFSCLENHLKGPQHLKFISNEENFSQLTSLISGMSNIPEFREKYIEECAENATEVRVKCERESAVSDELSDDPFEYDQKPMTIQNCIDSVPSINLNEILKFEDFGSSDLHKTHLERIFTSPYQHGVDEMSEYEQLVTEKTLFKDVSFSDIIPTDILPDNDRLFSSDASDNESLQQNVLNVIKSVFDEESTADKSLLLNDTGSEKLVNKPSISIIEQDLLGRTKDNYCASKCTEPISRNCAVETWTIKPVSEIKMVFVRCSVSPQVQTYQIEEKNRFGCGAWCVKDMKDNKLVLTRSALDNTCIKT